MDNFESFRPLLFSIAYRMLASAMDAEDIVQEVYLRYKKVDEQSIRDLKNFLSVITTRLSINRLSEAREKRESYIGPWLPEPISGLPNDPRLSPTDRAIERESISMAFLLLLEKLSPDERAVFILREVFKFPYSEISAALSKSEGACRKLLSRAKKHIKSERPRFVNNQKKHNRLLNIFLEAIQEADLDRLKSFLVEEASLWADGGGRIRGAATKPIYGKENIARFLISSVQFAPQGITSSIEIINLQPSIVLRTKEGQAFVVIMFDVIEDGIQTLRLFGNPDKLAGIAPLIG